MQFNNTTNILGPQGHLCLHKIARKEGQVWKKK